MSTRLTLLCAAATSAARDARFPDPAEPLDDGGRAKARAFVLPDPAEPLDDGGRAKARAFVLPGPAATYCRIAPTQAARDTAALLGVSGAEEPALRDIHAGTWTGRAPADLDHAALAAWLAAPEHGTPGGESMAAVRARVGAWLDALTDRHVLAITHAAVVRAAIAHALDVPVAATLAIDVAPLSLTMLSRHGRWRLQELRRGGADD